MTGPGRPALAFDPSSEEYRADSDAYLHRLRAADPVHRSPAGTWVVTRYADVCLALRDTRLSSQLHETPPPRPSPRGWRGLFQRLRRRGRGPAVSNVPRGLFEVGHRDWLLSKDPPEHTVQRNVVGPPFGAGTIERLRPRVQELADGRLDRLGTSGDLVAEFALPFPIEVLLELLGVPAADRDRFLGWLSVEPDIFDLSANPTEGARSEAGRVAAEVHDAVRQLVAARRSREPGSALAALGTNAGGLTEDELVANVLLLLFAGQETSRSLIAAGTLELLRHPEQLERLRASPALMGSAIEELLRFTSPVQLVMRRAREETTIGERIIRSGDLVQLMLGAANRDPEKFPDPDRLDLARAPNPHVAFGLGRHACLGAGLTRLEAEVAFGTLLGRLDGLRLAGEPGRWRLLPVRAPRSLPIAFTRRRDPGAARERGADVAP